MGGGGKGEGGEMDFVYEKRREFEKSQAFIYTLIFSTSLLFLLQRFSGRRTSLK
jgi:hypothetical protein